jgi:hypothetical protein
MVFRSSEYPQPSRFRILTSSATPDSVADSGLIPRPPIARVPGKWKLHRRGFLIGLVLLAVEPPSAFAFAGSAAGPYGIPYSDTY